MIHDVRILCVRLILAAPVLYVAVLMIIDPSWFVNCLSHLQVGIRNFEQQLGRGWRFPALQPQSFTATRRQRGLFRLGGLVLALYALMRVLQP